MTKDQYHVYLASPEWRKVSEAVKAKAGYRCQVCNSPKQLETHHRSYRWVGQDADHMEELICLCHECHQRHHGYIPPVRAPRQPVFKKQKKPKIKFSGYAGHLYREAGNARMEGIPDMATFCDFIHSALRRNWPKQKLDRLASYMSWPSFKSIVACDPSKVKTH